MPGRNVDLFDNRGGEIAYLLVSAAIIASLISLMSGRDKQEKEYKKGLYRNRGSTQNIGPAFPVPENIELSQRGPHSDFRNSNLDGKH